MVYAAQHDDADAVFAFQLIKRRAGLAADLGLAFVQGLKADNDGSLVFFAGKTENGTPGFEHPICADSFVLEIQNWIDVEDVVLGENITLFHERSFYSLGR